MPGINDAAESIEAIAEAARAAGASHLWAQPVFLKPCALAVFLPFALFYMKQPFRMDFVWAGLCLLGAVFFMFRQPLV